MASEYLDQVRRSVPDADEDELLLVAGELACGASMEAALERLQNERLRRQLLPPPAYAPGRLGVLQGAPATAR